MIFGGNIYVGLTSTTLSRRFTMHLSVPYYCFKKTFMSNNRITENSYRKTTILEHQNNKQKIQVLKALHIRNIQPKLNRIYFETSDNVLKCILLLTIFIKTNSKSKRYTILEYSRSSYKVVLYIQKLYHFCNTSFPGDCPELGRKYLGNN